MTTNVFAKAAAALVLAGATLTACGDGRQGTSDVKFDAAHSVALDGVIDEGRIIATSGNDASIKREILSSQQSGQLWYTVGQLNGLNGGVPDLSKTELSITEKTQRPDGLFDVKYAAKLFISWPKERAVPANFQLILPARGDWAGVSKFYEKYGSDEHGAKQCLAWEAHEVSQGIFWYYYRPSKTSCPLVNAAQDDKEVVTRANIRLTLSGENTSGKSPEYGKVWEDGKLVVTAIFGKNESGATDDYDAGVSAYIELHDDLIAKYGQPKTTSLPAGQRPSATNDEVVLTFDTTAGLLEAHLFVVDGIREVDEDFMEQYNKLTEVSDLVTYSGHSGLGANIRALTQMGHYVKGQYQIFLVNGCDTFAYVEGSLREAHRLANPEHGADKYFDMITNAMPSYFHMNATSNMALVNGLVGKTKTYREILAGFDQSQRAAVTGEQDNRWPQAFDAE